MKLFPQKYPGILTLLVCLLLAASEAGAQNRKSIVLKKTLDGAAGQLAKDSVLEVSDSAFYNPALAGKLDTPYKVRNIITFRINEYSSKYIPGNFQATASVRLYYYDRGSVYDSVDQALVINYDTSHPYTMRSSFVFNSAHRVRVKVLDVTVPAGMLELLQLDNEMEVQPVYKLSCTADAVKTIAWQAPSVSNPDELLVNWPVVQGADGYDLEWAYVDSSTLISARFGQPLNPALVFDNNTTRVSLAENTYAIPLMYDGKGKLFFRVRAVQVKENDQRVETAWSSAYPGGSEEKTIGYWRDWVRNLSIPLEWQDAVIRSAITLKLCQHDETGAIVAAITTSIPEAANTVRNWDYRFCWLRDSAFVVRALNRLGATRTMEEYLRYVANVASDEGILQPLYGIGFEKELAEEEVSSLAGYRGMGPVRRGNLAWLQQQHDVYGSVVLAATQLFFDQRLLRGDAAIFARVEPLGEQAYALHDQPDAGLWEFRGRAEVHTYSSVMCWAACDRLAKIAVHLKLPDRVKYWRDRADEMHARIIEHAYNEELGYFVEALDGNRLDASLLLLADLGFVKPDDPRFVRTVEAIGLGLKRGDALFRYVAPDDFGSPETSFTICTFWYIDALGAIGRHEEARSLFERILNRRNPLGLLSEDLEFGEGEAWGNFPQTYSHVGLINAAMRLSRPWQDAT